MKRLAAILLAAALVTGAWFARRALNGESLTNLGPTAAQLLYCDTAVERVCAEADTRDFEVAGSDPQAESERLVDPGVKPFAGWVTLGPWPQMVDSARSARGESAIFDANARTLATTPIVLVGKKDRLAVLQEHCGSITLACVAKVADQPWTSIGGDARWGSIIYGQDGVGTSYGLGCLLEFARSYFPDRKLASNDFQEDAAFADDLSNLFGSVRDFEPVSGSNLREFLTKPASASLVCTAEAEAASAVSRSRDAEALRIVYPDATTVLPVLVTASAGEAAPSDTRRIEVGDDEMLSTAGFRVKGVAPQDAASAPATKAATLPSPGVINALVALANEVSR